MCIYVHQKDISAYDLSAQCMSVMGFPKKICGGWGEPYPFLWNFSNFAKPHSGVPVPSLVEYNGTSLSRSPKGLNKSDLTVPMPYSLHYGKSL